MRIVPIPADELDRLRSQGHDDGGNPLVVIPGGQGRPVRCCLRKTTEDERIVLISYRPVRPTTFLEQNRPYDEAGPVFVHAEACAGYEPDGEFPAAWREHEQVLRSYSDEGRLIDGRLTHPDEDRLKVVESLLADDEVAFVHARSVGAGCFSFEFRP